VLVVELMVAVVGWIIHPFASKIAASKSGTGIAISQR
jgi:hypothetical protein